MARDYVVEFLDSDIRELDGVRRNKNWMRSIMRSYARNLSSEAPLTTIAADMQGEPLRLTPSPNTSVRLPGLAS